MRRTWAVAALAALLVNSASAALADEPDDPCVHCGTQTGATAGSGSFNVYKRQRSDHVDGRGDATQGYAPGKTTWTVVEEDAAPTCYGNNRGNADALCGPAVNTCPAGEIRFWIWHRTVTYTKSPDGTTTSVASSWRQEDKTYCLGADDPGVPTIAKVLDQVQTDFAHLPLRHDEVQSDPGPTTLVNIDTAFHAGSGQPQVFNPVLLGTPVHVTAKPTRWHWTWGDGGTDVTTTPGVPKQPVVSHRYTRTADLTVSVVVEWTGTFTVGNDPTAYPITASAFTPAQTTQVRSARHAASSSATDPGEAMRLAGGLWGSDRF
jgi:hypothetical protein